MILKNDLKIHKDYLPKFQKLIGAKIVHFGSNQMNMIIGEEKNIHSLASKEWAVYLQKEDTYFILKIWNSYKFNEILGDELSNLVMSINELEIKYDKYSSPSSPTHLFEANNCIWMMSTFNKKPPFVVQDIRIYGENRLREWGECAIRGYFSKTPEKDIPSKVYDSLFINNIIVLENEEGEQLAFGGSRYLVDLEITANIEARFINHLYKKNELIVDFTVEEDDWEEWQRKWREVNQTNEQVNKLLYHFSEKGIERFEEWSESNLALFPDLVIQR